MQRFRHIHTRMALVFTLTVTALLLVSSVLLHAVFSRVLTDRVLKDQKRLQAQNKANIESVAAVVNQSTVYLFADRSLADILENAQTDELTMWNGRQALKDILQNYMNAPVTAGHLQMSADLYLDPRFAISATLDDSLPGDSGEGAEIHSASAVRSLDWYRAAVDGNGELRAFLLPEHPGTVYISRQIRNQNIKNVRYDDVVGVVVVGVSNREFHDRLAQAALTDSARVWLVGGDGVVLYSSESEAVGQTAASLKLDALEQALKAGGGDTAFEGERLLGAVHDLNWKWRLISVVPYRDVISDLDGITRIMALITLTALAVGGVVTNLLSRGLSRPIVRLAGTMRDVQEKEHLVTSLAPPSEDEVGMLYDSFNGMMSRIGVLLDDIVKAAARERQAELKALQAQINPHFIYNTLDAVAWMALVKNEDEIVTMVSALAFILRYSLKDPSSSVALEEEILHVEKYAGIQQLRYRGRFTLNVSILDSARELRVPRFILQPLVENAILHGFANRKEEGRITIGGGMEGGRLRLWVEDDGGGADAALLNDFLSGAVAELPASDGIGIRNVHARVRLQCGEPYGLTYESVRPRGLRAVLVLPPAARDGADAETEEIEASGVASSRVE